MKHLLISTLCMALGASAGAAELYNASVKRVIPDDGRAYFYDPGPDNGGAGGHIVFDDVTVLSNAPVAIFRVTRVTVGISRQTGAAPVQITPYYAQIFQDSAAFGGAGDRSSVDPLFPQPAASPIFLSANGSIAVDGAEFSFGDGVAPLFNVVGYPAGPNANYRSFGFGLNFSTTNADNGWTVAQNSDNQNILWDYLDNSSFAEFDYGFDSAGPIYATQYLRIEGSLSSSIPGDADLDGKVDVYDLLLLATHWLQPGSYSEGDFNFDGLVNASDLGILSLNWQAGVPSLSAALVENGLPLSAVPESTTGLALLPLISLTGLWRRR